MAQELKSNLLLIIKPILLHYLRRNSLLSQIAYCQPCQITKVNYKVCEASEWHNTYKDVSDAKLLQMTILIHPVD